MKRSIPDKSIQGEMDLLKNMLQNIDSELELNNEDTTKCMRCQIPAILTHSPCLWILQLDRIQERFYECDSEHFTDTQFVGEENDRVR
jgi:hypothetical protein